LSLPRTPSQTVGPFSSIGLCRRPANDLVPASDPEAVRVAGRLLDGAGDPIDGLVEVWDGAAGRFGRSPTDAEGRFEFTIAKPPPVADEAPHLDVHVFARGLLKHQLTRMYFPDEAEANARDPVLATLDEDARETLVAAQEEGALRFDVRMQGDRATVFFAV
jgi:protocatechuate 3,4-dioxygenase, alpha subunit